MMTWFRSLSRGKQITWGVLGIHVLCVLFLITGHLLSTKRKKNSFTVHTVRLSKPASQPASKLPSPIAPMASTKPISSTIPPTKTPTNSIKQTSQTKAKSPSKSTPKSSPSVLAQIEQNLAQLMPTAQPTSKSSLQVPTFPKHAQTFPSSSSEEPFSAAEMVSAFLKENLELPEFGEVKVTLWIDAEGHLINMEILESKSSKNRDFLKNRLPELQFPCLNKSTSMTVVFRND